MSGLSQVPWVAIALTDIQNARPGALVTGFQATALASGQSDPTLYIIQKVTAEVLGAVGYSGRYTMDASQGQNGTVDLLPPNLFDFAVEKCCRMMEKRLAMPWTPDEVKDEDRYQKTLVEIRLGKYPIDATNNPSGSNISIQPGQVALNCGYHRRFQPWQLNNL
jgi:hypothetical protein